MRFILCGVYAMLFVEKRGKSLFTSSFLRFCHLAFVGVWLSLEWLVRLVAELGVSVRLVLCSSGLAVLVVGLVGLAGLVALAVAAVLAVVVLAVGLGSVVVAVAAVGASA